MWDYLRKVIKEFPEEIMGVCATPAGDYLFKVRVDGKKLNEEKAEAFHHTVYQLLFAANQAQRDIQTAVSFLTTRVRDPDEDDWKKLVHVLKYLKGKTEKYHGLVIFTWKMPRLYLFLCKEKAKALRCGICHFLPYLNGTQYMKLTLYADEMNFIIHPNS
jgi:hypothetical protein